MAGNTSLQLLNLSEDQQRAIITYATMAQSLLINQYSIRTHLEEIDRAYMRETDFSEAQVRARRANRSGDAKKFQNVTVPIIMPQVEAALGYFANVFCTGYPIFGVASDPTMEDAALQMETVIAENAITAGWVKELLMFFRDGLKYNLHGIECQWAQETVYGVETDEKNPGGTKVKTSLWQGNKLRRMDMYNSFFDPRVHPSEVHKKGEFAGYIEVMSRVQMKKFFNDQFGKINPDLVKKALESAPAAQNTTSAAPFNYFLPLINPYPLMDRGNIQVFDWLAWAHNIDPKNTGIRYTNVYQVATMYGRILPADFDLKVPERNTPQVWKFIIVNGQVVVYAERQPNAHNYIPIFFGQPIEDGLDFQTKSFATNVRDFQDLASAMWNGFIASKRRLIGDRVLYDPLRVREKDINSDNPAAKIPVRPSAYGKNVGEAVYQFPYRDEQVDSFVRASDAISKFADLVSGQNPAARGQFVKGNKTVHEYEDIMGHGNDRNQVMAMFTEGQVLTPLKEVIKLNVLQFQKDAVLFNRDKNTEVKIDPVQLRQEAVHFKVSDGLLPIDKEMSGDEWQVAMQQIGSSPALGSGYDLPRMFTYLMKMRGADLTPFEKSQIQVQFEQQQSQWASLVQEAIKVMGKNTDPAQLGKLLDALKQILQLQPQMPPALQQQMQQQQTGGTQQQQPSATQQALESTQGSGS